MKISKNKKYFVMILFVVFCLCAHALIWRYGVPAEYRAHINAYAARNNLEPSLIKAMIKIESKFNPDAVSRRGARGLMQIMPATAREIAENFNIENYNVEMLFDPEINIMFGAYYIRMLLNMFDGNLNMALAAYNAGMGNVEQWKYKNPMVEFEPSEIPFKETRGYVRKVQNAYKFYKGARKLKRLITPKKP